MQNHKYSTATLNGAFPAISPEFLPLKIGAGLPKILEENVANFCPSCGKTIFSNLLEIDGKVYIEKNCCTKELVHLENDVDFFQKHRKCLEIKPFVSNPKSFQEFMSKSPSHPVIALNITSKCNMNCPICFLKCSKGFKQSNPDLPIEAIREVVKEYKSREVLLYTAEPTTRKDLPEIIKIIKDSGNIPGMATNGLKLEDKNYVKELKKAGLKFIIFTFDGFNREANIRLRGKDYLETKLKALKNIKEVGGFRVALSVTIEKGLNEDEIPKILQFALKNDFINRITFSGLLPPSQSYKATSYSDLAKAMEKYGYFDKEYFLEMIKMNKNIHEVLRKIFERTPLENWLLSKLPDNFNVGGLFKKKSDPPELLFQKAEIEKINTALSEIMNKSNKAGALFSLLKNSPKLINSPLWRMAVARFSLLSKRPPTIPGTLEVFLQEAKSYTNNRLINGHRVEEWKSKIILAFLTSAPFAWDPNAYLE